MFGYFCVKKRIGVTALLVCLVVAAIRVPRVVQYDVMNRSVQKARYCICIDSGHGENDPGKIGVAGTKEKEVNLAIALKLKKSLEKQNIRVVMTRTDDRNLADANATNEKTSDMKNRVAKMDSEQPDAVISIHQNSYTDSSAKGAQVFYYSESKEGKVLAEILQKSLIEHADPENHRMAKANTSYYILKNTAAPTVIVECGFLSNPEEETLLNTAQYQDKLVDALQKGICEYLEN